MGPACLFYESDRIFLWVHRTHVDKIWSVLHAKYPGGKAEGPLKNDRLFCHMGLMLCKLQLLKYYVSWLLIMIFQGNWAAIRLTLILQCSKIVINYGKPNYCECWSQTKKYRSLFSWWPGPVFCLLLGASSDYAQPITGLLTSVTWPVIGWA